MSYEQAINAVISSRNLAELAINLDEFLQCLSLAPKKTKAFIKLRQNVESEILRNIISMPYAPYSVFSSRPAVLMHLANYWQMRTATEENQAALIKIIDNIRNTIVAPKSDMISHNAIDSVMEHIESKFSFTTKVLKKPLRILQFNHSHIEWHSLYSARIYESGEIDDLVILLCSMCNTEFDPAFTLLHELGHVLHTRITRKLMVPPESFDAVIHRMFFKKPFESDWEKSELFADCFAIASSHDCALIQRNPYNFIAEEDVTLLQYYMQYLIESYF